MSGVDKLFVHRSVGLLRDTYVPRIEAALGILPLEDLWWRPHEGVFAFGNVLLHLEGNVRQWILSGLGGETDHRERSSEFAAGAGPSGGELLEELREAVAAACTVVEGMDEETLLREREIQGFKTTGLGAVYHVVEHFSWHTAQAVWIAKQRAGANHGLAFYDEASINKARNL